MPMAIAVVKLLQLLKTKDLLESELPQIVNLICAQLNSRLFDVSSDFSCLCQPTSRRLGLPAKTWLANGFLFLCYAPPLCSAQPTKSCHRATFHFRQTRERGRKTLNSVMLMLGPYYFQYVLEVRQKLPFEFIQLLRVTTFT